MNPVLLLFGNFSSIALSRHQSFPFLVELNQIGILSYIEIWNLISYTICFVNFLTTIKTTKCYPSSSLFPLTNKEQKKKRQRKEINDANKRYNTLKIDLFRGKIYKSMQIYKHYRSKNFSGNSTRKQQGITNSCNCNNYIPNSIHATAHNKRSNKRKF